MSKPAVIRLSPTPNWEREAPSELHWRPITAARAEPRAPNRAFPRSQSPDWERTCSRQLCCPNLIVSIAKQSFASYCVPNRGIGNESIQRLPDCLYNPNA